MIFKNFIHLPENQGRKYPGGRLPIQGSARQQGFLFLICSIVLLNGCSFLPVKPMPSYVQKIYRRIPYKTEGQYRVIDIFYATDRTIERSKDLSPDFKPSLSGDLAYGNMSVKINPVLKVGRMKPGRFKRKGIIGIQKIDELEKKDFIVQLKQTVESSPHKSLLILVFGYKDNFEFTAAKAAYFAYLLDINTPVLLFDWPGDQPVSLSGYVKAQKMAVDSGPYLGKVLEEVIRDIKPKKVWVQSSSLGCQVVCSAFEYMYSREELSDPEPEIAHVILAAPDVGQDEFDEKFKDEISALSERLTTYVSSDDRALLLTEVINWKKKLGLQAVKQPKHEQFEEAKDILYLKSLSPDRISLVDVTPINTASARHGYYLESPEYFDDVYMRIFSKPPLPNRRLYLVEVKEGTDCWILREK